MNISAHPLYSALMTQALNSAAAKLPVERVLIGQVWTLVCVGGAVGLCMTPPGYSRTRPWAGSLRGRTASELIGWACEWPVQQSAVGIATLNAVLRHDMAVRDEIALAPALDDGNLAVFKAMAPELSGKVVVIGRYPGLDRVLEGCDCQVLERHPGADDLPDPAAEYLLPDCDWCFITASSLANKTLPRLLELAAKGRARSVLMGPSMPWATSLWRQLGVDYVAGVDVVDADQLWAAAEEGGGVKIFEGGVRYHLLPLADAPIAAH